MSDLTFDLDTLLDEAQEVAQDPTCYSKAEIAGIALGLARVHTLVEEAIKPLKEELRSAAREILLQETRTTGKVTLKGVNPAGTSVGTVTVTFPGKVVELRKGSDIPALKVLLGDQFGFLFTTKTSYAPARGFNDAVVKLEGDSLSLVLSCVDSVESTPRVGFQPSKSS